MIIVKRLSFARVEYCKYFYFVIVSYVINNLLVRKISGQKEECVVLIGDDSGFMHLFG